MGIVRFFLSVEIVSGKTWLFSPGTASDAG